MDPANLDLSRLQEASSRYAQEREAYEAMIRSGEVSPTGEIERLASLAGTVASEQPEVPELTALTGAHLKLRRGYFVRMEDEPRRTVALTAAPSLGPEDRRRADLQKIGNVLDRATGVVDQAAGTSLTAAIEDTLKVDSEIAYVRSRQAELLGG